MKGEPSSPGGGGYGNYGHGPAPHMYQARPILLEIEKGYSLIFWRVIKKLCFDTTTDRSVMVPLTFEPNSSLRPGCNSSCLISTKDNTL